MVLGHPVNLSLHSVYLSSLRRYIIGAIVNLRRRQGLVEGVRGNSEGQARVLREASEGVAGGRASWAPGLSSETPGQQTGPPTIGEEGRAPEPIPGPQRCPVKCPRSPQDCKLGPLTKCPGKKPGPQGCPANSPGQQTGPPHEALTETSGPQARLITPQQQSVVEPLCRKSRA